MSSSFLACCAACQGHDECPSDQYCAIDNKVSIPSHSVAAPTSVALRTRMHLAQMVDDLSLFQKQKVNHALSLFSPLLLPVLSSRVFLHAILKASLRILSVVGHRSFVAR